MTNASYEEAIKLLHERFRQNDSIINAHYGNTTCLRALYDKVERHLRSLQALGENVNTHMLVSLVMTKPSKHVITHLSDHQCPMWH